jgi:hypothetical protein
MDLLHQVITEIIIVAMVKNVKVTDMWQDLHICWVLVIPAELP